MAALERAGVAGARSISCLTRSTDPIPFDRDETHRTYDRAQANRFWRVLLQSDRVLKKFRSRFCGKCSPVHFFWGSFDLAVTRFSGRPAPPHPGGIPHLPDTVTREAYAQEVSSVGFWPGKRGQPHPALLFLRLPEPPGFAEAKVRPAEATYYAPLREFVLPYDAVRTAACAGRDAARVRAKRLRCGLDARKMGSRRARGSET